MADEQNVGQTGSGAAGGASAAPPASSAPVTPAGTPGSSTTTPSGQSAAPPATPTGYTYQEDRSRWIPPHRLSEESTRRQQLERDLEIERQRVRALTGVDPQNPQQQKQEQVRAAFYEMFPAMKRFSDLTDEQIDQLFSVPEAISQQRENEQRQWERHGNTAVSSLSDHVATALGTETLDAEQQQDLRDAFSAWLRKTAMREFQDSAARYGEGRASSQTLRRYEDGDPKLLEEFAGRYVKNWVDPARRQSTAAQIRRARPVPNTGDRSQVSSVKRPDTFTSLDERIEYAAKLAQERGVVFGR